jgi:hypothetical protein
MTTKEGTYKGYKYQLIDGFFIIREINETTKTSKCNDLWALLKEICPTVLRLREEEKIRILVHSIIHEAWYEIVNEISWTGISRNNLYEMMEC